MAIGSGISSSVSRHAKPNIMPWSPAPRWSSTSCGMSLAVLGGVFDTTRDVRRLVLDRGEHAARLAVEPELGVRVPDLGHGPPDHRRDVDPAVGGDLAGHDHEARRHECLARDAAVGVDREQGVEHRVGELVGELVGMPLGHGFRGEQVALAHVRASIAAVTDATRLVRRARRAGRRSPPASSVLVHVRSGVVGAVGAQDHRDVRLRAEPGAVATDLVHDHHVQVLRPELAATGRLEVGGLCGEPHEDPRSLAFAELAEDVGRRLEEQLRRAGLLLQLAVGDDLRTEVGDGGGHHDDVGIARAPTRRRGASPRRSRRERWSPPAAPGPCPDRGSGGRPRPARDASAATATPIFPVERFPMNRTGSIGSWVGPAVTSIRMPARSRRRAIRALDRCGRSPRARRGGRDLRRRAASAPTTGPDEHGTALGERRDVRGRRGVLPHAGVHRGREDERARGTRAGSTVSRSSAIAVRELRDDVGRGRRDDGDVDVVRQADVQRPRRACPRARCGPDCR